MPTLMKLMWSFFTQLIIGFLNGKVLFFLQQPTAKYRHLKNWYIMQPGYLGYKKCLPLHCHAIYFPSFKEIV